ncbi:MAG: hypothetical protein HOO92_02230 [Methylococcaceae bacterium]|nr:hypothetical protein [Methylococcaceae bacterium]
MLVFFHGRGAWFLNKSVNDRFGPRLSRNFVFKDPETGETQSTNEFYRLYDSIEQRHCQEFTGVFRLSPKDAIIYSEKKDLSHVEKLLPCDHQYSAFSIAVEDGCISKEAFGSCFFMIQKTLDSECFEHKPLIRRPYYLDNKVRPVGELDFADVFEEDIANKASSKKNTPIKFERKYYTVKQLARYWNIDISEVMQLGLTNQLAFIAQADWEYPDHHLIQRGTHTKINYLELSNIYHATEPFSEAGITKTAEDKTLIGSKCVITYYPGISHLIIDASEIERFKKVDSERKDDHLLESIHEHESNFKDEKISLPFDKNSRGVDINTVAEVVLGMAIHKYGHNPGDPKNKIYEDIRKGLRLRDISVEIQEIEQSLSLGIRVYDHKRNSDEKRELKFARQIKPDVEQDTLLKLLIGMAIDAYGYKPNEIRKSKVTGTGKESILYYISRHPKYTISPDKGSIKKYLDEAKRLLPLQNQ